MEHTLNDYLRRINDAAEASGFGVLEFDAHSSGYVTLVDKHGNEITIRSPHGIDTLGYIQRISAIDRVPVKTGAF